MRVSSFFCSWGVIAVLIELFLQNCRQMQICCLFFFGTLCIDAL